MLASDPAETTGRALPKVNDWTQSEKLKGEKETIGFYVSGHPLDAYRWKVTELTEHTSETLAGLEKGAEVALCGIITGVQRRRNKELKPWAIFQLEDWHGSTECLTFATRYELIQKEIEEDRAVLVRGKALPEDDGTVKINVQEIIPLDVARVGFPSLVSIRVRLTQNGVDRVGQLKKLFDSKPGETSVRMKLEKPRDFLAVLDVTAKIRPDKEFKAEVERICGAEALEVLAS
jgi:DNA polymerase-3 subunit alpha